MKWPPRLTPTAPARVVLEPPFVVVWILPVYWFSDSDRRGRARRRR